MHPSASIRCATFAPFFLAGLMVHGMELAVASPQTFETAKLVVPRTVDDVVYPEYLGHAVSASEDMAWVGEPIDDGVAGHEGAVFGFTRQPGRWVLQEFLSPSATFPSLQFGTSIAFQDRAGVVGAPFDSSQQVTAGSAFFLDLDPGGWTQTRVEAPDQDRKDGFGFSVALSGDRALICAFGDDDGGTDKGAAYVWRRHNGAWTVEQKLVPTGGGSWGGAGISLDLSGDVAVLGSYQWTGYAFVFERGPGGWQQTAILQDPTPTVGDLFGLTVAVDGDTIAVGEPILNDVYRPGSVLLFRRDPSGAWVFEQEVQASNKSTNHGGSDRFGAALDLHEDRLLVGAYFGKIGQNIRGTANLFERRAGGWEEILLLAPSEDDPSQFGWSVSLSSSFAVVGAIYAEGSVPGVHSGAAYVYELPLGEPTCDGVPNSTLAPGRIRATGSLKASAGALDLWASDLPTHQPGYFLLSDQAGFVAHPGGSQGNLCLGGSPGRFLASLQSSGSRGELHFVVDPDALPLPPPAHFVAGDTWHFQAWHRDGATSNFTGALAITFR